MNQLKKLNKNHKIEKIINPNLAHEKSILVKETLIKNHVNVNNKKWECT